jgi:hypothetical protein
VKQAKVMRCDVTYNHKLQRVPTVIRFKGSNDGAINVAGATDILGNVHSLRPKATQTLGYWICLRNAEFLAGENNAYNISSVYLRTA